MTDTPDRLEQIQRLEALQPEGHAAPRIAARQQQRACRVGAKARAEQRRRAHLGDDAPLRLGRGEVAEHGRRKPIAQIGDEYELVTIPVFVDLL